MKKRHKEKRKKEKEKGKMHLGDVYVSIDTRTNF